MAKRSYYRIWSIACLMSMLVFTFRNSQVFVPILLLGALSIVLTLGTYYVGVLFAARYEERGGSENRDMRAGHDEG